ncbi:MAG: sugar ABC transporter ATP-binding protein [Alphaproteobacteria bacterium]
MTTDRRPSIAAPPAVAVAGLTKSYGGIRALIDMDMQVEPGTIHAVVGENGAGKSTLMKILAGAVRPDAGAITLDGRAVGFASPADARRAGIGIVYQELSLFPDRTVLANVFADAVPTRFGLVDRGAMLKAARPVLDGLGMRSAPDMLVGDLDLAERQLVEISRVLVENPRLLILDEPNSALNDQETGRLFEVLRALRRKGMTMLYVSHRLEEVFAIADRITVMRNGQLAFTRDRSEVTMRDVVQGMVGKAQEELFPPRHVDAASTGDAPSTAGALSIRGLGAGDDLRDVTFTARPGEIIGLAGLEGSGVATLLGVLFGTRRATAGEVRFPDGKGLPSSPTASARRGVALVPADRRNQGLMLDRSVVRNMTLVSVGAMGGWRSLLSPAAMLAATRRQIERLRIKVRDPNAPVSSLSGGNQQKVVLGRWLEIDPRVLLLDDPTRGVDVGAKREIYLLIRRLAEEGRIVLFRSTELPELVGLADRILVFYRGRLALDLDGAAVSDHEVLHAINAGTLIEEPEEESRP